MDTVADAPADSRDISQDQNGTVLAWAKNVEDHLYDLYIAGEGGVNASLACAEMFAGCTDLKYIDFRGCFHTTGATSMREMFYNCTSLKELDVTCLDTSSVTDMSSMFYGLNPECELTIDLDTVDTSNVTEYENFMYYGDTVNGVPWTNLFN